MSPIATVSTIARYPVKSMAGDEPDSIAISLQGLPGDRFYAFVLDQTNRSWPYLTGRDCPDLLRYQPSWDASERPLLHVTTPEGATYPVVSEELRADVERRSGKAVRLHSDWRGLHDVAHISLITAATIRALAEAGGVEPDHRRFRMNLVLESDLPPFAETEWVGKILRIGDVRLAVTEPDGRCQMITLAPGTGASSPAVLKAAGQLNDAKAGVYATVLTPGTITLEDRLEIG